MKPGLTDFVSDLKPLVLDRDHKTQGGWRQAEKQPILNHQGNHTRPRSSRMFVARCYKDQLISTKCSCIL